MMGEADSLLSFHRFELRKMDADVIGDCALVVSLSSISSSCTLDLLAFNPGPRRSRMLLDRSRALNEGSVVVG